MHSYIYVCIYIIGDACAQFFRMGYSPQQVQQYQQRLYVQNKYNEYNEKMAAVAEKKAAEKRNVSNVLDSSPYVGLWLKRKATLLWVKRWMSGRQVNKVRLRRACVRHRLGPSDDSDMEGVEAEMRQR